MFERRLSRALAPAERAQLAQRVRSFLPNGVKLSIRLAFFWASLLHFHFQDRSAKPRRVGQPEQLAKRTFAAEAEVVTRGALMWEDPPEIGLVKVQGDGYLRVLSREPLAALPWPWPERVFHRITAPPGVHGRVSSGAAASTPS